MKNTKKGRMAASILSALLCVGLSLFSAGCSSGSDSDGGNGGESTDTAVSVSASPATMTSATGTSTITATVTGDDSAKVSWSITSGSDYASLGSESTTASGGKASVTLTGKNSTTSEQSVIVKASAGGKSGTVTVKVPAAASADTSKGITSVTLNRTTLSLLTEATAKLTATVTTTSGDIAKTVTWTSSDESVATVSGGTVTAVAAGSATITATSTVDETKKASCLVTVEAGTVKSVWTWTATDYSSGITTDKAAISADTVMDDVTVSGSGATWRVSNSSPYCLETGKTTNGCLTFTTTEIATITIVAASTGSSNTSDAILSTTTDTTGAVSEKDGKTTVTGSSPQTTLTYENVPAGTYYFGAFPATQNARGIRVYSISVEYDSEASVVYPNRITLDKSSLSLDVSDDSTTKSATLTATIENASEVTSGKDTIEWTSSDTSVATVSNGVVTAKKAGTATITASCTYGGAYAECEVTVTGVASGKTISASDEPVGYASITPQIENGTTVTTKTELVNALQNGGLIYVSGTIDMSEGCLPSTAGGTTAQLDAFVAANSDYSTYTEFKTAYAGACSSSTNDKSSSSPESTYGSVMWTLNKAYGNKIKLSPVSDTTIIGLDGAVIKGGTFQISGVSNVTIRNLTIQDAYDPFPHHEKDDGFNAQWDAIAVVNSAENIWIDHCTIEDTMKYSKVAISGDAEEKWQTYDGLCDITKTSKNVVVSYCVFKNHDKTMLIGSSDTDISGGYITIHHNKFLNCGQRLPMTAYPNMHIYNNSYERDSDAYYDQQASIAARYGAYTIIAENNYFGSGVKYCISQSTSPSGKCYESGNVFTSRSEGSKALSTQDTKPFTPSYEYELDEASDVPSIVEDNAGAGVWSVVQ